MAYKELIKNFDRTREYLRDFYVYGFRSRSEFGEEKGISGRSYDNEKRRIESWLGEYMSFRQDKEGKRVFLSVDSSAIVKNPLYQAFKAKSFTDNDIMLHFYILDLLAEETALSAREIADEIYDRYLIHFSSEKNIDESTVRKKLQEYVKEGLLVKEKSGRDTLYRLKDSSVPVAAWKDAAGFFAEAGPLGVIGAYILDQSPACHDETESVFSFKHHYILHALDSQILLEILTAIGEDKEIHINIRRNALREEGHDHQVCPMKVLISTQTGRQYLLCWHFLYQKFRFFRLDRIYEVKTGKAVPDYEMLKEKCEAFQQHLWGVSTGGDGTDRTLTEHIEMIVRVEKGEDHILQRLNREKRNGTIEQLSENEYRFSAEVYDALEMLPWIRTFTGRIQSLSCSNAEVTVRFYEDLKLMAEIYEQDDGEEEETHAVQ